MNSSTPWPQMGICSSPCGKAVVEAKGRKQNGLF